MKCFSSLALMGFLGLLRLESAETGIDWTPSGLRLGLKGEAGAAYVLEHSSPLGPAPWQSILTVTMPDASPVWIDVGQDGAGEGYYRLKRLPGSAPMPGAGNFRLVDHEGRTRELHYRSDVRAMVLVFVGRDCDRVSWLAPVLGSLRDTYEPQGILFWMVDSRETARTNLQLEAGELGLGMPILHDQGKLVAYAFGVTSLPEVVAVRTSDWRIFYRGAIDDRPGPEPVGTTRGYLADALASFAAGQRTMFSRTPPLGCELPSVPAIPGLSYATHVAPILIRSCVACHSPGNLGPFAMTNYVAVRNQAGKIGIHVLNGEMPPWRADSEHGVFSNDSSLRAEESLALLQWVDEGAPRGEGEDPLEMLFAAEPPPPTYPVAWPAELGQPDYIISVPTQSIPATGEVDYRYPQLLTGIPSNVWLRAAILLPGNLRVLHHALVFTDVIGDSAGLNGYFSGYVPGTRALAYPEGTGKFLPANQLLTFQMHYQTIGQAQTDSSVLGLYFLPGPPSSALLTRAANTTAINIPPGAMEYERQATYMPSATKDVWLHEMSPHMHYRGARFQYEALYPDGSSEVLLSVPHYQFHWQLVYRLAEPKRLPAGTVIRCSGAFDNSPLNHENPDPTATVRFGEQSDDEMFIGYLNYSEIP